MKNFKSKYIFPANYIRQKNGNFIQKHQVTMVNSKQLTNKSKSTPKMSLRSVMQNTPTTSEQNDDNNDELVNTVRGIIKEALEEHEKKLNEILKSQLQNTNERLDKISYEVLEIKKQFRVHTR